VAEGEAMTVEEIRALLANPLSWKKVHRAIGLYCLSWQKVHRAIGLYCESVGRGPAACQKASIELDAEFAAAFEERARNLAQALAEREERVQELVRAAESMYESCFRTEGFDTRALMELKRAIAGLAE
jgi:hypothetical protein